MPTDLSSCGDFLVYAFLYGAVLLLLVLSAVQDARTIRRLSKENAALRKENHDAD